MIQILLLYFIKANTTQIATETEESTTLQLPGEAEESFSIGITKTIVIAVCSSVAYLALVIGLVAFCGIRLMKKKQKLRIAKKGIHYI